MGCTSSIPIHLINYDKKDRDLFLKKKYKFFTFKYKTIFPCLNGSISNNDRNCLFL